MRNAAKWGVVLVAGLGALALSCSSGNCPGHFKTCGNVCVDIYTDAANCGACGNACTGGNVCANGTCTQSCPVGETACGASCRDLQTDVASCGACGKACGPGQSCNAGVCGCPPGMPVCGPNVLVWSDTGVLYSTAPEATGAVSRLKGVATTTTASGMADFVAAYDAGGFDVVVVDETDFFPSSAFSARINDWVSCGGRFIINAFPIIYPAPNAALGGLLGITAANPQCVASGSTVSIFPDKSTVDLWGPVATVPSPLAPTAPNLISPFCGIPYPQYYELTAAPGGAIAGRFTTAGTGPGAIAVTRSGHVVVHAFNPSDYRLADTNTDGIPDIQALYENEIAYLVKQGPAGLTCSGVEAFDSGTWPYAPWTLAGGVAFGSLTAGCAHDGPNGFSDGGAAGPGFYYRTDVSIGSTGDKISMWFLSPAVVGGRAYLGAGATTDGAVLLTAGLNTGNLLFQTVSGTYGTYTPVGTATTFTWSANTWYRMEVQVGSGGALTGVLYASDGFTVLATTTATVAGFAPGGVAIRSFGGYCLDTIKVYR